MSETTRDLLPATGGQALHNVTVRDWFAGQALAAILPVADDTEKRRGNNGVQG